MFFILNCALHSPLCFSQLCFSFTSVLFILHFAFLNCAFHSPLLSTVHLIPSSAQFYRPLWVFKGLSCSRDCTAQGLQSLSLLCFSFSCVLFILNCTFLYCAFHSPQCTVLFSTVAFQRFKLLTRLHCTAQGLQSAKMLQNRHILRNTHFSLRKKRKLPWI